MVSKIIAGKNIGDMHFHNWYLYSSNSIAQGYRGMAIGSWVENNTRLGIKTDVVQIIEQGAFMVALKIV